MTSKLDYTLSALEHEMFRWMEDELRRADYRFLSVHSLVNPTTLRRQGMAEEHIQYVSGLPEPRALAGSAEQGILEHFADQTLSQPVSLYAYNQCFRREYEHVPYLRLSEFRKMEQFVFTTESNWLMAFEQTLDHVVRFLHHYGIEYRVDECTSRDPGYHQHKIDVEINTPLYGWVESHSLTYFGSAQCERLGIVNEAGAPWHSISATGIASPRILLPFIFHPPEL